jgi:DNA primase
MTVVDEIKERIDAVELISNYVQLKRAGRNYKGLCPFHAENTPSFVVFPDTGTWHCFGACSEGGDIFSFVMKREGWDFRTALEELARTAGVELRPRTEQEEGEDREREKLREILTAAVTYYHNLLLNAPPAQGARDYVARRGFGEKTIKAFRLGYAPDEWHALENYLVSKNFTRDELISAGLLVDREDGRVYDRFRGRLMIPISDTRGRVVGFGARTLDADGEPKYLNSPQTALFDKSNTLYGLDQAAKGIRATDRAVIVEGYMDVIQAHQAGFSDVVAQLGTALTEDNVRRLSRYTRRIILALDPDTAGRAATMRGLDVAREAIEPEWEPVFDERGLLSLEQRLSADIRVLALPKGKDPDDVIREDPSLWAVLVDEAKPLVEHYMQTVMNDQDLADPKVKAKMTEILVPIIRQVVNPAERAHYAQRLARKLRVDERALLDMITSGPRPRSRRRSQSQGQNIGVAAAGLALSRDTELEAYCLQRLLHSPGLVAEVNEALVSLHLQPLSVDDFQDLAYREMFRIWIELVDQDTKPSIDHLAERMPAELRPQVNALSESTSVTVQNRKWFVEAQVQPGQDIFDLQPDEAWQDLIRSLLKLRQQRLLQRNAEMRYLLEDADEDDARLYEQVIITTIETLARIQRAMSAGSLDGLDVVPDARGRI